MALGFPGLRLDRLRPGPGLILAAGAGGVLALGQAPFSLAPVAMLGLVLGLALAHGAARPGRVGWAFGTAYFAVTLHWIVEPFLVDIARHGWMAPFALVFLSAGLGLFWMLAFAFGRRLGDRLGRSAGATSVWIAIALSLAELARGYVLTGFPWGLVGYIWVGWPMAYWAAVIGPYGLTALTIVSGAGLVALLSPTPVSLEKRIAGVVPLLALIAIGLTPVPPPDTARDPAPEGAVIRLVQPNAPQALKWEADWIPIFFQRLLDLTAQPAERPPDVVVWPEVSVAYALGPGTTTREMMLEASGGAPVIAGHLSWEGDRTYNALSVIRTLDGPADIYRKHHLVPFGEYIPFGDWLLRFGINGLAVNPGAAFAAGPGPHVLKLGGNLGAALPLICYEAVFPSHARVRGQRPDWLLHVTNDAWFGAFAGPYQHLAQARMRAIEQGLPLLRAANTGVSALIDPFGRVIASLPLDETGFLDVVLPAPRAMTVYARTGDVPMLVVLLMVLAGGYLRARKLPR